MGLIHKSRHTYIFSVIYFKLGYQSIPTLDFSLYYFLCVCAIISDLRYQISIFRVTAHNAELLVQFQADLKAVLVAT